MQLRGSASRTRFVKVATATALAGGLAACGSTQPSADASFKPQGGQTTYFTHAPSTPSPDKASSGPAKPNFPAIPDDTDIVFETPLPKKQRKAKIVRRWRYAEISTRAALFTDDKPWKPYASAKGARGIRNFVHSLDKENVTVAGTLRLYKTHFTVLKKNSAVIETCVSEADWFARSRKTGKVHKNPVNPKYFYLVDAVMQRTRAGWVLDYRRIDEKPAKECQR